MPCKATAALRRNYVAPESEIKARGRSAIARWSGKCMLRIVYYYTEGSKVPYKAFRVARPTSPLLDSSLAWGGMIAA